MTHVRRRTLLLALLALMLSACGRSDVISEEKARALALRQTPMTTVEDVVLTPPGPAMWSILGADKDGRPMAVWLRREVEGQVYLDQGTSRTEAVKTATLLAEQKGYSVVSPRAVLVNPAKPTWWVSVQIGPQYWGQIFVDLATGAAQANPNDPWDRNKGQ